MFREKIERILLRIKGEMTLGGQVTLKALVKRGLKIGDNCNIGPGVIIDPLEETQRTDGTFAML